VGYSSSKPAFAWLGARYLNTIKACKCIETRLPFGHETKKTNNDITYRVYEWRKASFANWSVETRTSGEAAYSVETAFLLIPSVHDWQHLSTDNSDD
jgi:hypothetical protein